MAGDLEIARAASLQPIAEIAAKLAIPADALVPYGRHKAKIGFDFIDATANRPEGALVLVSGISPTPAGEGKTTTTIGLGDALTRIGVRAAICLREPSLGPSFGQKGGATGGGRAQVVPMEDINLHFNGDFHAITSANNLLAAMVDNHLYLGQCAADRSSAHRRPPRPRRQRPGAAVDRQRPGRRRQRRPARGRVRHYRRLRGDGGVLHGARPR